METALLVKSLREQGVKLSVCNARIMLDGETVTPEIRASVAAQRSVIGPYLQAEADAYRLAAEVWRLKDAGQHAAASALFDSPAYLAAFDRVVEG